ncbi:MAG: hypothetical protein A2Y94_15495 [Caldithrix sp. RBG_13_44_9]|nr:MAG: hypothetical protein A2Y94_15495 [Caldithrix sp. RBG_13_44_9]
MLFNQGYIHFGTSIIDVGDRASPVVVDWNNDGKKDLLSGNDLGYVKLFLNSGTNSSPVFNSSTNLMSGGNPIQYYRTSPEVYDLNQDGKKDLLVGDSYGYFYFYANVGSDQNPVFDSVDTLTINTIPPTYLWVNQAAKFDLADWDEDGDMDIISGEWNAYVNLFINTTPIIAVDNDLSEYPSEFSLEQNYPNPFNPATTISYTILKPSRVNISIYDITGQLVTILVNEFQNPGTYSVKWNSEGWNSGVYLYRLTAGEFTTAKKCIIVK